MSAVARGRKARQATRSPEAVDPSGPKTTRPEAESRRPPARPRVRKAPRTLDAFPDRVDIRDWPYRPRLEPLPDLVVNTPAVPVVLDQKNEGACTGFALAAVINFHLARRQLVTPWSSARTVSPRMLYEMARRYDEWPGEEYEGSSARGGIKGWVAHGVCARSQWPDTRRGKEHLTPDIAKASLDTPGGAYYRVDHRNVRDMHAALHEAGILYATLMVHDGWFDTGSRPGEMTETVHFVSSGNAQQLRLPIITRAGRSDSGHAVALVGYTRDGLIVQNSWGTTWGAGGFALLPYEDWLIHATDCWVAQLGVPVGLNLWREGAAAETAGVQRASAAIPLADIRPYVVDVGNNGLLSDSGEYWTSEEDVERIFGSIAAKAQNWATPRILLYLHGGLNDEKAVARRVVAFRDVLLANEIYPIHIMWETGFWETLKSIVLDQFTDRDERAGGWLSRFREGLLEARDRTIELTVAPTGRATWDEMKENAALASRRGGGMDVLVRAARRALGTVANPASWELHVVAHSAGSIFVAHAMKDLLGLGVGFRTIQLFAPAIRVDEFKALMLPALEAKGAPRLSLYLLSDTGERDDDVGPYGKSLLYLVSNAFEGRRGTPLLGMEKFAVGAEADPKVGAFLKRPAGDLPTVTIAGKAGPLGARSRSDSHGGFDNDPDTLNSMLFRILGAKAAPEFNVRHLQY
jgi:hypothetical protein